MSGKGSGKKGQSEKKPDSRFKKDARFKNFSKGKKTKLDPRFKKALKSNLFHEDAQIDKYGRNVEQEDHLKALKKEFDIEDDNLDVKTLEKLVEEEENQQSDEEANIQLEEGVQKEFEEQEQIPCGDATKRIAIVNCDWENTSARDLFALLSVCVPNGGKLESVSIYPSQFGAERMKQEEVEGMPKYLWKQGVEDTVEIIEDKKLTDPNWIPTFTVVSDDKLEEENPELVVDEKEEEAIEEEDNDEDLGLKPVTKEIKTAQKAEVVPVDLLDPEKIYQYEQDKLKYYFAVAVFDSIETANEVYNAVDGEELEFCEQTLDLRFVPDDTEFPYKAVDVCTTYEKVISRDGRAKSNKIKLTWDTNEQKRNSALKKNWMEMEEEDLVKNEEAYKEFMEHSSDYEDEEHPKEESDKIRQKYAILLGEDEVGEDEMKEGDMVMTYTTDEVASTEKKTKKKDKKEEEKKKEELELLMMDDINENREKKMKRTLGEDEEDKEIKTRKERRKEGKKKSKKEKMDKDFKIDVEDDRFKKVLDSHDFDIDPTNPEFVATRGMKQLLKDKHKRFEKEMRAKK
ncbi:Hypothetical protein KM1_030700 [Entamoeba histolytica HM-3:IMSS]|uniref:NUC153 domain containing protein n=2 Tax=Entamoeba histolytica TaxID=5759 RepID=M2RGQ8_ENTHI|nr:NUC153 domain containing protein [Entamoeba histolytica KU27]EMS10999.1 Hypothetical protein KM1_030700 [Entamoeba histolytica HM-3:IMSS]